MDYLFIYGTLLMSDNPFGLYLSQQSKYLCQGRFKGLLYNVGEYPGAVYNPLSDCYVYGSIIVLDNQVETLKKMDEYEGFGIKESQPNEFIRQPLEIETEANSISCWVYLYNYPVESLFRIKNGDYIRFLAERA